jgi:hypothetical protein
MSYLASGVYDLGGRLQDILTQLGCTLTSKMLAEIENGILLVSSDRFLPQSILSVQLRGTVSLRLHLDLEPRDFLRNRALCNNSSDSLSGAGPTLSGMKPMTRSQGKGSKPPARASSSLRKMSILNYRLDKKDVHQLSQSGPQSMSHNWG